MNDRNDKNNMNEKNTQNTMNGRGQRDRESAAAEMKRETFWNRNFIICVIASTCASFAQNMLNPALPVFGRSIGIGTAAIGTISAAATFICMFGRWGTGKLSDFVSKKKIMYTGLIIALIGDSMMLFAGSLPVFAAARILQTVGNGIKITVASALIVSVVPYSRMSSGIAMSSLLTSLATCFAPNIGTNMAYAGLFRPLFLIGLIFPFFAGIALYFVKEPPAPRKLDTEGRRELFDVRNILCGPAVPGAMFLFFAGITHTAVSGYLSLYGLERELPQIGLFFTVNAIAMMVTRPVIGKLCDTKPLGLIIIPGHLLEAAAGLLLAFTSNMPAVCIAGALYGIGFGSVNTGGHLMALRAVGDRRRGEANGTFYVLGDVGLTIGNYLGGIIMGRFGGTALYVYMAAVALLANGFFIVYSMAAGKRRA